MPLRSALAVGAVLLLAGCADDAAPDVGTAASDGTASPAASVGGANTTPAAASLLPIVLDGSTATQVNACVEPLPPCQHHALVPGTSDLMLTDLAGRIERGRLEMSWTAASPATEELAFGIMLMGGTTEECAPVSLGILRGTSPLALDVEPMERAICPDEVLHVWASNGIYVGDPPAYVQLDVDQAFRIEGDVTLGP